MLLNSLRGLVSNGKEELPESSYAMKKIIDDLRFSYKKFMHALIIICFMDVRKYSK